MANPKCKGCMKPFETLNEKRLCPECDAREKASPYRSPVLAAMLSIIPGAGQYFYLGEKAKGNILLGVTILLFGVGLFIWPLLLLIPGGMLISMSEAWTSANRINRNKTQLI